MLPTLLGTVAVAWTAVFLARPRRPIGFDDTPWFVYSRYCGARDRIFLFALILTAGALLAGVIALADSAKATAHTDRVSCSDLRNGQTPTCYRMNQEHAWELWERDDATDGKWRLIATVPPRESRKP